jgi:hypothetical protein
VEGEKQWGAVLWDMWSSRACKFSENFATVKDKSESEPHSVASLLLFAHSGFPYSVGKVLVGSVSSDQSGRSFASL